MLPPILCFGPTPALQRALRFRDWDAPGDVTRTSEVEWSVGGKASNAARAVCRAGGNATLVGPAGGMSGERMKALWRKEDLDAVWVETEAETRICQTLLDADGKRIRELVEDAAPLSSGEWGELYAKVEQALPFHSALLLCGSLPREAPEGVYAGLVDLARDAGRKVVLDAKGEPLRSALSHQPDLVKINRNELEQTTGKSDTAEGIRTLQEMGARAVMITDGPHTAWVAEGKKPLRYTLPEIEPLNPIGGGDTVTGVTTLAWVGGSKLREAAREGLGAGTAQTLTPRPAEFDPTQARAFARKIKTGGGRVGAPQRNLTSDFS